MRVSGIDHVNILTEDLDGTAAFYETLLGLRRTDNAGIAAGRRGAWMRDTADNAIVHLVWNDPASDLYKGYEPGKSTNAVHHVAFGCQGFEAMRAKLEQMGTEYRVNDRQFGGLRQIFLIDPNAVNLELNFAGD